MRSAPRRTRAGPVPRGTATVSSAPGSVSGCENHEDNQYLLYVYKGGLYKACTRDGVCGEVLADR